MEYDEKKVPVVHQIFYSVYVFL